MYKKCIAALLALGCLFSSPAVADAAHFSSLGGFRFTHMRDNNVWKNIYKTRDGIFVVKLRKMPNASYDQAYHLMFWLNNKKIFDGYLPQAKSTYECSVFKDSDTDKLFWVIQSDNKSLMLGYDSSTNSLKKVLNSGNYDGAGANMPKVFVDENSELQLYYTSTGDKYAKRYKLIYNSAANNFYGEDITIPKPPPPPPKPVVQEKVWEPEPEVYYYTPTYTENVYYEPEYEDVTTGELEDTVGS